MLRSTTRAVASTVSKVSKVSKAATRAVRRDPVLAVLLALAAAVAVLYVVRRRREGWSTDGDRAVDLDEDRIKKYFLRDCAIGISVDRMRDEGMHSWLSKYDYGELKAACEKERAGAKTAVSRNALDSFLDQSRCGKRAKCPRPDLSGQYPCMNKKETKCCNPQGKNCVNHGVAPVSGGGTGGGGSTGGSGGTAGGSGGGNRQPTAFVVGGGLAGAAINITSSRGGGGSSGGTAPADTGCQAINTWTCFKEGKVERVQAPGVPTSAGNPCTFTRRYTIKPQYIAKHGGKTTTCPATHPFSTKHPTYSCASSELCRAKLGFKREGDKGGDCRKCYDCDQVTLYAGKNHTLESETLNASSPNLGDWNDRATSMCIPVGKRVTVYQKVNFNKDGKSMVLNAASQGLHDLGLISFDNNEYREGPSFCVNKTKNYNCWNESVSSIQIQDVIE